MSLVYYFLDAYSTSCSRKLVAGIYSVNPEIKSSNKNYLTVLQHYMSLFQKETLLKYMYRKIIDNNHLFPIAFLNLRFFPIKTLVVRSSWLSNPREPRGLFGISLYEVSNIAFY